jgi:hypothetical protein
MQSLLRCYKEEYGETIQLSSAREADKRWRIVEFIVELSSAQVAVRRGSECRKLKNLHC